MIGSYVPRGEALDEPNERIASSQIAHAGVLLDSRDSHSTKKLQSLIESAYRLDPRVQQYKEQKEQERLEKEVWLV